MSQKGNGVDYTDRDFDAIRQDLLEYVKRYYPETFQDFNQAGFGMTVLELLSYIGDQQSFYIDYQANESFLDTAIEQDNVLRLARQNGFKVDLNPSSFGTVSLYILVPSRVSGQGPDPDYFPTLRRGSIFSTNAGNKFMLSHNVDFSVDNEIVVGKTDDQTGLPTQFAIKKKGRVVSGELKRKILSVGAFERFKKVELGSDRISEVISVEDEEGREWYEVPHLSQNYILKSRLNSDSSSDITNKLEKNVVPRRFTFEKKDGKSYLQFGFGSENEEGVVEPDKVAVDQIGKEFVSDTTFDPTRVLKGNSMGIAPSNTNLDVVYRENSEENVNAAAGELSQVTDPRFVFNNPGALTDADIQSVRNSMEVENEEPIIGDNSTNPTVEEIRRRSKSFYTAQDRAVTADDYETLVYSMPAKFGAVKRVKAIPDKGEISRNVNLYLISEKADGTLISPNMDLKENIKRWISMKKGVNDTVNLHDSFVVNIGIQFVVVSEKGVDKFDALNRAETNLANRYSRHFEIGQDFRITEVYNILNETQGVADAVDVEIVRKFGADYSDTQYDIRKNKTADGRYIHAPKNLIFEVLNPNEDISGEVK